MEEVVMNKKDNSKIKHLLFEGLFYLGLFLFTFLMYLILKPFYNVEGVRRGTISQGVIVCLVSITLFVMAFFKKYHKLTLENTLIFLIVIGFLIKLGYMLYTPYNTRQYDTVTKNMDGHEAYAWIIYTTGELPTTNDYQFYHPPFNALVQAGFMHISKWVLELVNLMCGTMIFNINDMHVLFGTCQILSVMYMTLTTVIGVKIIRHFKMSDKATLIASIFIIFFPRFIQLSGQLNNDAIVIFLSFVSIYYSLKWWEKKDFLSLMIIAISIGLAMMAKVSGATICITTAFIFIYEYVKAIRSKDKKSIINLSIQYVLFLLVCAPLGLWFQVYAKVRFDQPFGYVFNKLNHNLSVADYNFFQRFINIFDFKDLTFNLFAKPFDNYNLFAYLVKTSIFGEFSYWQGEGFALGAIIFNYLFIVTSIILLVVYLIKAKKENFKGKVTLLTILLTQAIMMLYFNIKMPYGCTMDFRYIVPITIAFSLILLFSIERLEKEKRSHILVSIVTICSLTMIILSNLFYMVCI